MKRKVRRKKKVIFVPDGEFVKFALEKIMWYGSGITVWWKIHGCKAFLKWAKENGMKYRKEDL